MRYVVFVCLVVVAGLGSHAALRGSEISAREHHRDPGVRQSTVADSNVLARLQSLGYGDSVGRPDQLSRVGVVHHDPRAHDGLTLYKSRVSTQAHLIDLDGKILHTWTQPPPDIADWASFVASFVRSSKKTAWNHIKLLPGGALLGIVENRYIEKIDWDSKLVWRTPLMAHHDFDVAPDGRILALTQRFANEQSAAGIVDNGIAVLSADGEILREHSLSPLLLDRVDPARLESLRAAGGKA
jgi:hypothetical protein